MSNYFDTDSERCLDCDGHFRHFMGCPDYVGDPTLDLDARVALRALIDEVIDEALADDGWQTPTASDWDAAAEMLWCDPAERDLG